MPDVKILTQDLHQFAIARSIIMWFNCEAQQDSPKVVSQAPHVNRTVKHYVPCGMTSYIKMTLFRQQRLCWNCSYYISNSLYRTYCFQNYHVPSDINVQVICINKVCHRVWNEMSKLYFKSGNTSVENPERCWWGKPNRAIYTNNNSSYLQRSDQIWIQ